LLGEGLRRRRGSRHHHAALGGQSDEWRGLFPRARPAEFLFPPDARVRDLAAQRRDARQTRLPRALEPARALTLPIFMAVLGARADHHIGPGNPRSGLAKRYPCSKSQPSSASLSRSPGVSTPSATTRIESSAHSCTIARTMLCFFGCTSMP